MTNYLRFTDEAQAIESLADFRIDDNWLTHKDGIDIDVIGTIYKPTGVMLTSEDGMEYPEMAPVPGWHVNVRLADDEDGSALEPFAVVPTQPVRVWV